MTKTLLLCFIHGFKGDDNTFGTFPEHLRALLSHALPKVQVKAIVYPQFETRGDLSQCVSRFRDWLQEKIIDIEVLAHTPSPTIDPSVHTVLIGHSMGGIVAADALLAITNDHPIPHSTPSASTDHKPEPTAFLFPYIAGVLAFDTPYLGISPGVVAHGAETHITTAQTAITQLSGLTGMFWGGSAAAADTKAQEDREREEKRKKQHQLALPAPESASAPAWQKWGKVAMFAGAAGVVAAGSAAAYMNRQQISEGFGWATSHLEFVGCLMRAEELRKRVESLVAVNRGLGVGWANFYTRLGSRALNKEGGFVGKALGNERTFCNLPKSEVGGYWRQCINDNATDETRAHMTMFFPKDNPGYYAMSEQARDQIVQWTRNEWYESSTEKETLAIEIEK